MAIPLRKITPSGLKVPMLGFGGMRLPGIDQATATNTMRRAVELGVKYIETSPGYGDSEEKIGIAVEELGVREKVLISTKSSNRKADGMKRDLERSLNRLRTHRFDFYHMWYVNEPAEFKTICGKGGALAEAKKAQEDGLFDHLGITTHAKNEDIKHFTDSGEFELVTLYYNAYDAGVEEAVDYAHKKKLGVVVMGPLKGGFLSSDNSEKLSFMRDEHAKTNAQGALRWLAADPRVSVIAVGYTSPEQVNEAYAAVTTPPMTKATRKMIVDGLKAFDKYKKDICSCCDYCKKHCPQEIQISSILTSLAQYDIYGIKEFASEHYKRQKVKADACTQCGECAKHCPQKLDIPALLEKAHALLGR